LIHELDDKGKIMSYTTSVPWCDHTVNLWIGCTKVSDGCKNCYAERENKRYRWVEKWGPEGKRRRTSMGNWKKPLAWNKEKWLECICGWRGPEKKTLSGCPGCGRFHDFHPTRQRVFCDSLSDVFENRPELPGWRNSLFLLVRDTPNLDWLILTKRPENALKWGYLYLPDNVWIGTTCENQEMADKRIPELVKIPAKVHFISIEPMLSKIYLALDGTCPKSWGLGYSLIRDHIDWVIAGCESGPDRRITEDDWVRDIVAQCVEMDVPAFVKQLSGSPIRHELYEFPEDLRTREFPR
jgi:protein gp37